MQTVVLIGSQRHDEWKRLIVAVQTCLLGPSRACRRNQSWALQNTSHHPEPCRYEAFVFLARQRIRPNRISDAILDQYWPSKKPVNSREASQPAGSSWLPSRYQLAAHEHNIMSHSTIISMPITYSTSVRPSDPPQ